MSDATPVPSKPWWQSKTVILNLIALVSMMLPPVREWLDGNTETPLAALAALNLLVRFATKGKISLFPADDGSAGGNAAGGNGASGGHNAGVGTGGHDRNGQRASFFPWLVVVACAACLLMAAMLTGCTPAQVEAFKAVPITIGIEGKHGSYGYSSKGGLTVAVKAPRVREEKCTGPNFTELLEREWAAGRYAPGPLEQWPPIERKPRRLVMP